MYRRQLVTALLLVAVLTACGADPRGGAPGNRIPPPATPPPATPSITRFAATNDSVFVGDPTQLIAEFSGESAEIDGLGPVVSGTPVETPILSAARTFTLKVHAGGQTAQASVTVAAQYRDRLRQLRDAAVARKNHVAMSLPDGSALVMGGNTSESINVPDTNTSSRFDPGSETFARGPDLAFSAAIDTGFTTVLPLRTGFLLAGGGPNAGAGLQTPGNLLSQTFDPAGQRFARAGDLQVPHQGTGSGALLADGRVLLTGGGFFGGSPETEIYDQESRTWRDGPAMGTARRLHTATLLRDGRVLIVGGLVCCVVEGNTVSETVTEAAELFDPATARFTPTGSLGAPRALHQATLLADGRVLISGGFGPPASADAPDARQSEIYDPASGRFSPAGDLQAGRMFHSAVSLTDGRVLVVGGFGVFGARGSVAQTEIYDPRSNTWSPGPILQPAWLSPSVTLLGNGKVLIHGGEDGAGFPEPTTFLFE